MTSADSRCRVAVFSEVRFETDADGVFHSEDPALVGDGWRREIPDQLSPILVARAAYAERPAGDPLRGEVRALPHYVGARQAGAQLFQLWREIDKSLEGCALALVRVPGVLGAIASVSASRRGVSIAADVVGDAVGVLRSGALGKAAVVAIPMVRRVTRSTVARAQAVRYVTRRQLQETYPPSENASEVSFSDVQIAEAPGWSTSAGQAPHLVSMGSMDQLYKGHHLLIEALSDVRDEFPDVTLTIIGSGRHLSDLQSMAHERGVEEAVRFAGYLGRRGDVEQIFRTATLFVLPSLTEGMPRVLIEAMAFGLPAIASRVGGVPELLPMNATFDPGDVPSMAQLIKELHRSPQLLDQM